MRALSWALAATVGLVGTVAVPVAAAQASTCAIRPGRVLTLRTTDAGRTFCTHPGVRVEVVLAVTPVDGTVPAQWWQPVDLTGAALTGLPNTAMPMRGTTLGHFRAAVRGTATLSSRRQVCAPPPPGGLSCDAIQAWSVTVTVR